MESLRGCTFKPKISENAKHSPTKHGSFYQRNIDWKQKLEAERKEKEEKALKVVKVKEYKLISEKAWFSKKSYIISRFKFQLFNQISSKGKSHFKRFPFSLIWSKFDWKIQVSNQLMSVIKAHFKKTSPSILQKEVLIVDHLPRTKSLQSQIEKT